MLDERGDRAVGGDARDPARTVGRRAEAGEVTVGDEEIAPPRPAGTERQPLAPLHPARERLQRTTDLDCNDTVVLSYNFV